MTARAEASLFWPGITRDIAETRNKCGICNSNAPSQPAMPSTTPMEPEYHFQHLCADFFHHEGVTYLVLVDRFSNWPIVSPSRDGAQGLIASLRQLLASQTHSPRTEPEFTSHATRAFLKTWGVHHQISSAYHPHANCRAEVAVKTMKRLIAGNTGPGGSLSDRFYKALLQYRNGHHEDITRNVPVRKGHTRPPPRNPAQVQAPHRMGRQNGSKGASTLQTNHFGSRKMG